MRCTTVAPPARMESGPADAVRRMPLPQLQPEPHGRNRLPEGRRSGGGGWVGPPAVAEPLVRSIAADSAASLAVRREWPVALKPLARTRGPQWLGKTCTAWLQRRACMHVVVHRGAARCRLGLAAALAAATQWNACRSGGAHARAASKEGGRGTFSCGVLQRYCCRARYSRYCCTARSGASGVPHDGGAGSGPFRRFDGGGWTTSWELWEALNGCDEVRPCAAVLPSTSEPSRPPAPQYSRVPPSPPVVGAVGGAQRVRRGQPAPRLRMPPTC
jgi:hypothetical protein